MAASTEAGSIRWSGPHSAGTGVAPAKWIAAAVATIVCEEKTTSSPGPMPAARTSQMHGVGGVGHADDVLDADIGRQIPLELLEVALHDERAAAADVGHQRARTRPRGR